MSLHAFDPLSEDQQSYQSRRQRKAGKKKASPRQPQPNPHVQEIRGLNLKDIKPLTENQKEVFYQFASEKHLLLLGSAGTGKTFLSFYLGLREMLSNDEYNKIVIVRSAVQSRDQGFLPGSVAEKSKVYELPYQAICSELFGRGDAYQILKNKCQVEFITTSFIRGITLKNCIVIVDEIQNCNASELHTIFTRLGTNCRVIFCGDLKQNDLASRRELSGFSDFVKVLNKMSQFSTIEFNKHDIVRSSLVKEYIIMRESLEESREISLL